MPVDPRGVLTDPPAATHPAGPGRQGGRRAGRIRARSCAGCARRSWSSAAGWTAATRSSTSRARPRPRRASTCCGWRSAPTALVEALGADLERARGVPSPMLRVRASAGPSRASERVSPTTWRAAAVAAGATPTARPPGVEEALRRFGPHGHGRGRRGRATSPARARPPSCGGSPSSGGSGRGACSAVSSGRWPEGWPAVPTKGTFPPTARLADPIAAPAATREAVLHTRPAS